MILAVVDSHSWISLTDQIGNTNFASDKAGPINLHGHIAMIRIVYLGSHVPPHIRQRAPNFNGHFTCRNGLCIEMRRMLLCFRIWRYIWTVSMRSRLIIPLHTAVRNFTTKHESAALNRYFRWPNSIIIIRHELPIHRKLISQPRIILWYIGDC